MSELLQEWLGFFIVGAGMIVSICFLQFLIKRPIKNTKTTIKKTNNYEGSGCWGSSSNDD